jgi:leucyl-tRNA synthetase
MAERYDYTGIEEKWQKYWQEVTVQGMLNSVHI